MCSIRSGAALLINIGHRPINKKRQTGRGGRERTKEPQLRPTEAHIVQLQPVLDSHTASGRDIDENGWPGSRITRPGRESRISG